ncbi:hypothetical protein ABZP36_021077 [Zizania latifolia]
MTVIKPLDDTVMSLSYGGYTSKAILREVVVFLLDNDELDQSWFSMAFVHHIDILDVCLLNIDCHASNILIKKSLDNE